MPGPLAAARDEARRIPYGDAGRGSERVLIGLMGAIETDNTLLVILSMVLGGVTGALIDIDGRMNRLGQWAQRKLTHGEDEGSTFAKGFVTASLVYCVGAMAVVGALDSGIRGDHSTLIAKAALDGVTAVIFASSLGIGVMLSAVPGADLSGGRSPFWATPWPRCSATRSSPR